MIIISQIKVGQLLNDGIILIFRDIFNRQVPYSDENTIFIYWYGRQKYHHESNGAICSANIAPLDSTGITFLIMLFHHPIFMVIIGNPFMAALITDYTLIAFSFKWVNPLSGIWLWRWLDCSSVWWHRYDI